MCIIYLSYPISLSYHLYQDTPDNNIRKFVSHFIFRSKDYILSIERNQQAIDSWSLNVIFKTTPLFPGFLCGCFNRVSLVALHIITSFTLLCLIGIVNVSAQAHFLRHINILEFNPFSILTLDCTLSIRLLEEGFS